MREEIGNIWDFHPEYIVVIPTNITTKRDGTATMGAGLAKQCKEKFPGIEIRYGYHCNRKTSNVIHYVHENLFMFPTKFHWKDNSNIELIQKNCSHLRTIVRRLGYPKVALPLLGCGLGNLSENEVLPILKHYFWRDNYLLVRNSAD